MTEEERGDVVRSNGEVGRDGDNLEDGKNVEDEGESVKLFVGQVPKHMTEEDLVGMFKEVAIVDEVNIIKDKVTRASRGGKINFRYACRSCVGIVFDMTRSAIFFLPFFSSFPFSFLFFCRMLFFDIAVESGGR